MRWLSARPIPGDDTSSGRTIRGRGRCLCAARRGVVKRARDSDGADRGQADGGGRPNQEAPAATGELVRDYVVRHTYT